VSRPIPPDRLERLIEVATNAFIAQGYQRTQVEDVAIALGVAKGTLYGYVESKAALFDVAVRCADGHEPLPSLSVLPLPTPEPGATVAAVRARLIAETENLELLVALARTEHPDPAAELGSIVRVVYTRMCRNGRGIKLVDRCAQDQPELAEAWFGQGRWAQHAALVAYLEQRIGKGLLRPVPNTQVAARAILEAIAFWAVHRHWDPSPQAVEEADVEATLLAMTLHGLAKETK
jgi:AcrR family transcriptional regulator